MLNQGKGKRTVEDFNQFCSFVLAYAGYIPNEDWRCNARVRRDSSTGGSPCCEDSVSPSDLQSYSSPSQSERASEVKLEEEQLGTTVNKEKGKKRKGEKRNVLDEGRRANKRSRDAGGGMKSFGTKKPTEDPCPLKHKFERADGASLCSSLGAAGPISASDSNECRGAVMAQPLPEDFVDVYGENTRDSALNQHPQEHTDNVDWAISSQDTRTGWGHLKIFGGAHVNMWCNDFREWPKDDHSKNGLRSEMEVKAEPVDLSMLSQTGQVQNAVVIPQKEEKVERPFGGTTVDGRRNVKDLVGGVGRGSLLGKETWEDREGEAVDIMRLVMEQRLTGNVPEDQETGYHTDWASSTPEQGGSDTDQDTHATDGNTNISSAFDTENASAENGVLKEEDDSWDLITCFCMKPFAGRPMIECGECGTWVHLSCAKIRRTHVPDVFVCQPCRDAKQNIRRSGRARTASRKRFGD